ncbi:MAG: hypothetical protein F9K28_07530 [Bacteroidetes bacterium]|nr:MAG: hypothetical protein F9K28_07530 [Bacteroidota bacterium]
MSHTNTMPMTIREWQKMFNKIYGKNNKELTDADAWIQFMEETGEFAKIMRKQNYAGLGDGLADLFAWLCAFADHRAIDIEDALWRKYPRICPYCEKHMNCVCIAETQHAIYDEGAISHYIANIDNRPKTFSEWYAMFKDIYGNMNRVISRESIGFHLIEEVGQVARKIRAKKPDEYALEMADVFAWLIAVTMKFEGQIASLDTLTWEIYPGICKECEEPECICLRNHRKPK